MTRTTEKVGVLVKLPADVKRAAISEAQTRESNMNDICVEALAEALGVKAELKHRRAAGEPGASPGVLLRMPRNVKDALATKALRRRSNLSDEALRILAEKWGLEYRSGGSGRTTPFGGGRPRVPA